MSSNHTPDSNTPLNPDFDAEEVGETDRPPGVAHPGVNRDTTTADSQVEKEDHRLDQDEGATSADPSPGEASRSTATDSQRDSGRQAEPSDGETQSGNTEQFPKTGQQSLKNT
ncbi:hypothetical protein [Chitinimonas naiadis]